MAGGPINVNEVGGASQTAGSSRFDEQSLRTLVESHGTLDAEVGFAFNFEQTSALLDAPQVKANTLGFLQRLLASDQLNVDFTPGTGAAEAVAYRLGELAKSQPKPAKAILDQLTSAYSSDAAGMVLAYAAGQSGATFEVGDKRIQARPESDFRSIGPGNHGSTLAEAANAPPSAHLAYAERAKQTGGTLGINATEVRPEMARLIQQFGAATEFDLRHTTRAIGAGRMGATATLGGQSAYLVANTEAQVGHLGRVTPGITQVNGYIAKSDASFLGLKDEDHLNAAEQRQLLLALLERQSALGQGAQPSLDQLVEHVAAVYANGNPALLAGAYREAKVPVPDYLNK